MNLKSYIDQNGTNMEVLVQIMKDQCKQNLDLPKSATALEVLKRLEIPPDTVIITRNGKPIPIDSKLDSECELIIIPVVSGG